MDYINLQTMAYPVSEWEIKQANKNTSFPIPFEPPAEFVPVQPSDLPAYDRFTHKAVEAAPVESGGVWMQQWQVVALTSEEAKALVPSVVTMRQARMALLGAGLLDDVEAAINALPSPQKEAAKIEWEYSQEVQRHNGFVSVLAPALGLNESQLDTMFIQASQL